MIFNIVSGKGGTGKTLFCATLAEMLGNYGVKTVVIDMDFAVRGLTALLYYYQGESFKIVDEEKLCTYDFFEEYNLSRGGYVDYRKIGIARYRSFDVIPAVSKINQIIKLNQENESTYEHKAKELFRALRDDANYEHIILDCRAGYDHLNSILHKVSDISICVQEEDEISTITTNNLVRQFELENLKPIFSIVNKARNSDHFYKEHDEIYKRKDVTYLGTIPFDLDVMTSFGKPDFWYLITKTLYYYGVSLIWNRIATKSNLSQKIVIGRISPLGSNTFERRLGFLSINDRVLLTLGMLIGFIGVVIGLFGTSKLYDLWKTNGEQLVSFSLGIFGFLLAFYIFFKSKKR